MVAPTSSTPTPAYFNNVALGEGATKVIVPLSSSTLDEAIDGAQALAGHTFDIVEWRLDFFDSAPEIQPCLHLAALLTARVGHPILATFRTSREGGNKDIDNDAYTELLSTLAISGSVSAVDVEISRGHVVTERVVRSARDAGVPIVGSFHDFTGTPDVGAIVAQLIQARDAGCDVAKAAYMPRSARDVAHLLEATAIAHEELEIPVITMAMGPLGVVSRAAGAVFGSAATFASVGQASAPGQIPVDDLLPVLRSIDSWSKPAS